MKISEIYRSLQGEGRLTGTPSTFVRVSGCNLRCWFCDTPYASWHPEGEDLSLEEILDEIDRLDCEHVVLTGGEPMLYAELVPLTAALRRQSKHITIETAGTLYLPVACDLMSISPKLAGTGPRGDEDRRWSVRHDRTRHAPDVIRRLAAEHAHQFKFVVETPEDCQLVEEYLVELSEIDRSAVLLMPLGTDREALAGRSEWLEVYCQKHGLTHCPRRQIEWFGFVRGT